MFSALRLDSLNLQLVEGGLGCLETRSDRLQWKAAGNEPLLWGNDHQNLKDWPLIGVSLRKLQSTNKYFVKLYKIWIEEVMNVLKVVTIRICVV